MVLLDPSFLSTGSLGKYIFHYLKWESARRVMLPENPGHFKVECAARVRVKHVLALDVATGWKLKTPLEKEKKEKEQLYS